MQSNLAPAAIGFAMAILMQFPPASVEASPPDIIRVDRCNTTLHLAAEVPHKVAFPSDGLLRLVELEWRRLPAADLRQDAAATTVPATLVPSIGIDGLMSKNTQLLVASIPPRPGTHAERRFRLETATQPDARKSESFRFDDVSESSLGIWEGEHPVLVYNHGVVRREKYSPRFDRSGYAHPIYGLDGEVLTDDFPRDHPHHRGLFWAWAHVRVGDKVSSPWHVQGIRNKFVKWLYRDASAAAAVLGVENGWYDGDSKVVTERVSLRVYPACGDERAIDVDLTLVAETSPVVIWGAAEKSYGGMTVRFGPRNKTTITTPSGRSTEDLNLAHLAWADLTAQFPGAGPERRGASPGPLTPTFPAHLDHAALRLPGCRLARH